MLKNLAKKVRDSIAAGGNFADYAKRYSADPGSAASGGELGWIDKGKLVGEYERAAYNLQSGEISQPVESPFGFHIIQTLDKRKDAIQTKHILFKLGGSALYRLAKSANIPPVAIESLTFFARFLTSSLASELG